MDGPIDSRTRGLKVFLCHSSGDRVPVRGLYQLLLSDDFDPWLDEIKLLGGQDWNSEIRKAVSASDVVLVCLSTSSIAKEGYVQKEISIALDVTEEKPEGRVFIIPVLLEQCDIPRRLSRWHCVRLFDNNGYDKLKSSLLAIAQNNTDCSVRQEHRCNPSESPKNPSSPIAPEVVLLSPTSKHFYRWVPEQFTALYQGAWPKKGLTDYPVFGLRNLSGELVMAINIDWSILEGKLDHLFMSNESFQHYNAKIEEEFYQLTNSKGHGSGMPAADHDRTIIPYCNPNGKQEDIPIDVPLPLHISNTFALRLVATKQRPDADAMLITVNGPRIRVTLKYRQTGKEYTRFFLIESSAKVLSDAGGNPNDSLGVVGYASRSSNNFRGLVAFSVISDKSIEPHPT